MTQDYRQSTPNSAESTSLASPPQSQHDTPTVILVMGASGCGKTSFVDKAIGHQCHNVKANIRPPGIWDAAKFHIDSFSAELDGKQYLFFDTTGSSRAEDNDPHEIASLCQQLCDLQDFNGILYIQPISDSRINKQGRQYLELFEVICGKSCMKNVLLLTNHWDDDVDPEVGENKEKELRTTFWKGMIDAGATVERLDPTMPECVKSIVERFSSCPPAVLAIKDEMVHQKKKIIETPIWRLMVDRIDGEAAAIFPQLKHLDSLETPEQLRTEVYKLTLKVIRFEKEHTKLLQELHELRHYKEIQSKSIWHRLGFPGGCILT